MDKGALVPDEVTIKMLEAEVNTHPEAEGFIFDGFPRTVAQAEALDKLLSFKNNPINLVISLQVKEEELIKRLVERGKESGRVDDNEEVITKRIKVYHQETSPVADFYNEQDKLVTVEGIGSIGDIFEAISSKIELSLA
jgi:adenylate kinase